MNIEGSALKEIKGPQLAILRSLALNGPGNIQVLHERESINSISYPTTLRAVRELWRKRLIFLSNLQDRGPKSAQEYSLMPLGVAVSFLLCDLMKEFDRVYAHWALLTPNVVKHLRDYEAAGLGALARAVLSDVCALHISWTQKAYDESREKMSELSMIQIDNPGLSISRELLDRLFLEEIMDRCLYGEESYEAVASIANSDPSYRVVWKDYIERLEFKTKLFRKLGKTK